jgi:hypothetical protein
MKLEEMIASVAADPGPPGALTPPLRALWLAKKGEWDAAHDVVNNLPSAMGTWIHAHLHRIEGDLGNAAYWYHRAGRDPIRHGNDLDGEWRELVRANEI